MTQKYKVTAKNCTADTNSKEKLMYQTEREKMGMTQKEAVADLSVMLGRDIDTPTLSRYETGDKTPPYDVVVRMAILYRNKRLKSYWLLRSFPEMADCVIHPSEISGIYQAIVDIDSLSKYSKKVTKNFRKYAEDGSISDEEKEKMRTADKAKIDRMMEHLAATKNYIDGIT